MEKAHITAEESLDEAAVAKPEKKESLTEQYSEEEISALLADDVSELKDEFYELESLGDILELPDPLRYAALRDLGLTPREAYLATSPIPRHDNRAHLRLGVAHTARRPASSMTRREWQAARELFSDLSDAEIEKLYRKVTK